MENNCNGCLFYEKCHREVRCDGFYPMTDGIENEDYFFELHNEYFNDFLHYLKEFNQ